MTTQRLIDRVKDATQLGAATGCAGIDPWMKSRCCMCPASGIICPAVPAPRRVDDEGGEMREREREREREDDDASDMAQGGSLPIDLA